MALDFLAHVQPPRGCEVVRRLGFAPQTAYENGGLMCTSACTCMCIMLLSGGIDTAGAGAAAPRRHGSADRLGDAVAAVMAMASRVHGIVESGLCGRPSQHTAKRRHVTFAGGAGVAHHEPPPGGGAAPRMAGVWEVFRCLGMPPGRLGIDTEEFIVVGASRCGGTVLRPTACVGGGDARPRFLYTPSRCFITIGMVPDCLRTSDSTPCGCVLTCGGHSICAMHDGRGTFALFDPLPSSLAVGLTGRQLADEIARSPSMQGVRGAGRPDGQCDATVFFLA